MKAKLFVGKETLYHWCKSRNIRYMLMYQRCRNKGLSANDVLGIPYKVNWTHWSPDRTKSLSKYCKENGINYGCVRCAISKYRMSPQAALKYAISRQGMTGVKYTIKGRPIREYCTNYNHYQRAMRLVRKGWLPVSAVEATRKRTDHLYIIRT